MSINRTMTAIVALCLLFAVGCAPAARHSDASPAEKAGETRVYEVLGMDCPGCHGGLEKLVERIPAVLDAEANWEEKRLAVTVREGEELVDEDVFDAIRRANFTAGDRIE
jgi:copper chaperone CopZ